MEEPWNAMKEPECNISSVGWAMNWEDIEDNMHFSYLARSMLAKVIFAYFQIIEFKKNLRGYNYEQTNLDFDILCPIKEIRVEVDDEFYPLFLRGKPLMDHMLSHFQKDLLMTLPTIANSPFNFRFNEIFFIGVMSFSCDHIAKSRELQFHLINKLPRIHLPKKVSNEDLIEDVAILGLLESYLMIFELKEIQPNDDPVLFSTLELDLLDSTPIENIATKSVDEENLDSDDEFKGNVI